MQSQHLCAMDDVIEAKGLTMTDNNDSNSTTRRTLLKAGVAAGSFLGLGMSAAFAAKASKGSVGYRDTPNGDKNCANCSLFVSPNSCKSVDGAVSPNGWCKIWRG
jgi:hypothetical protein